MTVAETVPITGSILVAGWIVALAPLPQLIAAALLGAILGFAPFNKPVARLFLGDMGSLPIGLILGWLLLFIAGRGHLAAAILLPLYYLADATLTLLHRLWRGEKIWRAHRFHFYQRALDKGLTVPIVVRRVFLTNLGLCALAMVSIASDSVAVSAACLAAGAAIVGVLLAGLARGSAPRT
jgi:UDP-N-acetylmuramyl pentapeptide phosphotransferase/UDP-N-acetylglucosamine-1-phosphate transferase